MYQAFLFCLFFVVVVLFLKKAGTWNIPNLDRFLIGVSKEYGMQTVTLEDFLSVNCKGHLVNGGETL